MSLTINGLDDFREGDIGFTSIKGVPGAGVLLGQAAIDIAALLRGMQSETAGWLTHAYMITDTPGDGRVGLVEAMPSGARKVWMEERGIGLNSPRWGPGFAYARIAPDWLAARAARAASAMRGTRYGWAQYAAIAALTIRGGMVANPQGWLARYVRRSPEMICSQLVDEAYQRAGMESMFNIFDDGRPPGYVTPGALFWQCARIGEIYVGQVS